MVAILIEDCIGSDASRIGFPNLICCAGLVALMNDNSLIGVHIAPIDQSTETGLLARVLQEVTKHGGTIAALYCISHWDKHLEHGGMTFPAKANALGFTGTAYLVNLDRCGKSGNITYGEIQSTGNGACSMRYKRFSKMEPVRSKVPTQIQIGSKMVTVDDAIIDYAIMPSQGCLGGAGMWHNASGSDLITHTFK